MNVSSSSIHLKDASRLEILGSSEWAADSVLNGRDGVVVVNNGTMEVQGPLSLTVETDATDMSLRTTSSGPSLVRPPQFGALATCERRRSVAPSASDLLLRSLALVSSLLYSFYNAFPSCWFHLFLTLFVFFFWF